MIVHAHTGDILGQWKSDWKCFYTELTDDPQRVEDKALKIFIKVGWASLLGRCAVVVYGTLLCSSGIMSCNSSLGVVRARLVLRRTLVALFSPMKLFIFK